ncbi:MAG: carboxylesterase family protein [Hyphomonadaceae bacterium]|nr:carboxylesterase family protein [Hyphomonadaceae bacterium]
MRVLAFAMLALALAGCASTPRPADDPTLVRIDTGLLHGAREGETIAFRGVPFAAPPVGDLRWRAPQPAAAWEGVREATADANDCSQLPFAQDAAPVRAPTSEDCLYLNVWRPAAPSASPLPVMVWIYGGGLTIGGISPAVYGGAAFARDGVVFVSMNYRVGRFGFFAHPALSGEHPDEVHGNYGYADQIAALQWVQRNIAAFGGDPGNVSIFGESAGGGSVAVMMTSPLARGLFHKAMLQSAGLPGGRRAAFPMRRLSGAASGEAMGLEYARSLGIAGEGADAAAALRALPGDVVRAGVGFFMPPALGAPGPMVDGKLIIDDAETVFAAGGQAMVPTLIGANDLDIGFGPAQDKAALFATFGADAGRARALYDPTGAADFRSVAQGVYADRLMVEPARHVADVMANAGQPAFHYRFSYAAESLRPGVNGAVHASEIPYVFDTLDASLGTAQTQADRDIAATAHAYWIAFARSGDPNGGGRLIWPRHTTQDRQLMNFTNAGPVAGADPWQARLDLTAALAERAGQ